MIGVYIEKLRTRVCKYVQNPGYRAFLRKADCPGSKITYLCGL
jgi:hypothetical protein